MKEYSGYDTYKKGTLKEYIEKCNGKNIVFVSDYFFCVNDNKTLHFFYNPKFYWDSIPLDKIENYVLLNLQNECAVLHNVDLNLINENGKPVGYQKVKAFDIYTPRIGNHYSCLGSRILTHNSNIFLRDSYFHIDNSCDKKSIKHFDKNDLNAVMYYAVVTKTPNYIKSIFELKCFKKPMISKSNTIIGAVIGDVIGSVFEWNNTKTTDFDLFNPKCDFTDDTVLTIAVADSILNKKDFAKTIWEYGRKYRGRGYGGSFRNWLQEDNLKPYGSFGNGSAMRVSAIGFAFNDIETVLEVAKQTAEVTHNHPEGIKGAQATAAAIFLARHGKTKQQIKDYITETFKYNLDFTLDEIRPTYKFDVTCQGSVPQAIVAFLESSDFESAIRLAISIGGDSDTIACITGGIASAYYKQIPQEIIDFVVDKLPSEYIEIMNKFDEQYDRK
jgi:ADP-ribosylglycohydrolase